MNCSDVCLQRPRPSHTQSNCATVLCCHTQTLEAHGGLRYLRRPICSTNAFTGVFPRQCTRESKPTRIASRQKEELLLQGVRVIFWKASPSDIGHRKAGKRVCLSDQNLALISCSSSLYLVSILCEFISASRRMDLQHIDFVSRQRLWAEWRSRG